MGISEMYQDKINKLKIAIYIMCEIFKLNLTVLIKGKDQERTNMHQTLQRTNMHQSVLKQTLSHLCTKKPKCRNVKYIPKCAFGLAYLGNA